MLRRAFTPGRCLAAALALALLALGVWLPGARQEAPLAVAVGMWPENEAFMLAGERGLLPAARFQFLEVPWPSVAYRAFDNGVVQAALFSIEDIVNLMETGEDMKVVCFLGESRGADVLLAGGQVQSVSDLKGQRVGVDLHSPGLHLLEEALSAAGLRLEDVETVPVLQPEMEDALAHKDVSAVVASEPWATGLRAAGARALADSAQAKTPIYRVLAVKTRVLENNRRDVEDLVRAFFDTGGSLRAPAKDSELAAILRRQRMTPQEFTAALGRIRSLAIGESQALLAPKGPGAALLAARVKARGGAVVDPAAWLDASVLNAIAP
jgi:NitT/TauT family transport system substrate-binding protein